MTIKQICNTIIGATVGVMMLVIVILSVTVSGLRKDNIILRQEKNYLSQTLDKMKNEEIKKNEIMQKQSELLSEVREAKTMSEYVIVWQKINKELQK